MNKIVVLWLLLFSSVITFSQGMKKVFVSGCTRIINETEAELVVTARMEKGWHVYCFNAGGDGTLISPELTFDAGSDVTLVGKPIEKGHVETRDDAGIGPYHFFAGKVEYVQKVKYKKLSKVKLNYYYQTCDEKGCLPPDEENIVIDMNVSCDGSSKASKDSAKTAGISDTQQNGATQDSGIVKSENIDSTQSASTQVYGDYGTPVGDCGEAVQEELSIWTALFYGILGGFAALFFPCTLPMIPMTISFFLKGSGDKKEGVKKGILYGFFIFLVYFLLSLPFILLGWQGNVLNSFSTNVWVNLVFFIIFIVFAFSLFGYYDISLPSFLTNKVDEKSNIGSISGIFFMALTLAIVSFSCTGPILGLVLGNIKNAKLITPAMSGFGIGLGLPFALFAMFPNLLKAMPKSGGWLTVLKVVFGFVELAFALKFLSNADLVKQWGFLKRELFIGLWILICVLTALYLLGKVRFKKDPTFHSTMFMKFLALACFVFAGYLARDYFNKDINLVSGFPPPKFYSWFYKSEKHEKGGTHRTHDVKGLKVHLYLEDAMEIAIKENKPVLIDFTGWACVNCRKMEENVWTNPDIYSILQKDYVIASLYVDEQIELPKDQQFASPYLNDKFANTVGEKWMDLSLRHFKSATQPFYALIDPGKKRILNTPKPYTPNTQEFKGFLECGIYQYRQLNK